MFPYASSQTGIIGESLLYEHLESNLLSGPHHLFYILAPASNIFGLQGTNNLASLNYLYTNEPCSGNAIGGHMYPSDDIVFYNTCDIQTEGYKHGFESLGVGMGLAMCLQLSWVHHKKFCVGLHVHTGLYISSFRMYQWVCSLVSGESSQV